MMTPSLLCLFLRLDLRLSTLRRKALAPSRRRSLPLRLNLAANSSLSGLKAPGGRLPYLITGISLPALLASASLPAMKTI